MEATNELGYPAVPETEDERELLGFIRQIHKARVLDEDALSVTDVFKLIEMLAPEEDRKTIQNAKKNYGRLKNRTIGIICIDLIPRLFVASLWKYENEMSESTIKWSKWNRRFQRIYQYQRELEKQIDNIETEKGYVQEHEHHEIVRSVRKECWQKCEDIEREKDREIVSMKIQMKKDQHHINHLEQKGEYLTKQLHLLSSPTTDKQPEAPTDPL
jgi:hypothetical protein